jgi:hypothetical protein
MKAKDNKTAIYLISFFIGAIILLLPWQAMLLKKNERTCGFIYGQYVVKGAKYIQFSYKTSAHGWITSSQAASDFKVKNSQKLKKMKCLKLIYSSRFNKVAKIIDERVLEK